MTSLTTPDGAALRVTVRGSGAPILLVHGWKGSRRIWDRTVAHLEHEFRVVAYDLRGMGESDKPDSRYDFDEYADDLAFVLEDLDLHDVTLVGWSMGCSVSLQHMTRGGARVGRLALVNGPVKLIRSDDFPWSMTQEEVDGYIEAVERSWPEAELEFQRATLHRPVESIAQWLYAIALQTPLDVVLKTVRAQSLLDHREVIRSLQVPVLAVYGKYDPYYPVELAQWIAREAPRGQAVIMEQSAHFPFLEADTRRFNDAVAQFARAR